MFSLVSVKSSSIVLVNGHLNRSATLITMNSIQICTYQNAKVPRIGTFELVRGSLTSRENSVTMVLTPLYRDMRLQF